MEQQLASWVKSIDLLLKVLILLGGLIGAVVTALWALTKFILERGLLPPSELTVDCTLVGEQGERKILQVLLHIKNVGTSTLVVSNLRADVRYLKVCVEGPERAKLFGEVVDEKFGTLMFPNSLLEHDLGFDGDILVGKTNEIIMHKAGPIQVGESHVAVVDKDGKILAGKIVEPSKGVEVREAGIRGGRGIPILRYDTIVQAGVNQEYSFVTTVPTCATFVLVYCSFRYGVHPGRRETKLLNLARAAGLIHYSLSHIAEPHVAQRVFDVTTSTKAPRPGV